MLSFVKRLRLGVAVAVAAFALVPVSAQALSYQFRSARGTVCTASFFNSVVQQSNGLHTVHFRTRVYCDRNVSRIGAYIRLEGCCDASPPTVTCFNCRGPMETGGTAINVPAGTRVHWGRVGYTLPANGDLWAAVPPGFDFNPTCVPGFREATCDIREPIVVN